MLKILAVLGSIVFLLPVLSPKFIYTPDYYFDNQSQKIQRGKVSILQFFLHQVVMLVQEILIGIAVPLGLKGSVTILIFLVVGADLYFRKGLTSQGLIISIVGVIALYLDQLVEKAKSLEFLKGLFKYESK